MTILTAEQRRVIEREGVVRIEDPESRSAYVILRAEDYDRVKLLLRDGEDELPAIPEAVRRSQEAFFRDLPALLKDEASRGRWIAYRGDERIGIADDAEPLIRECLRRGLKRDQYDLFVIRPQSPEPEEVSFPSSWL